MNELIIVIVVLVVFATIIIALAKMYGNSKEKEGRNERSNEENAIGDDREKAAKDIESQPPLSSPDDVADAFDRMRDGKDVS